MLRERKQIVVCIVALAVVVGFVLFCYLPLRKRMKALERDRTVQQSIISRASYQAGQLPQLKQRLLELQKTAGDYRVNVPAQKDLGAFLQKIANLMNEARLSEQFVEQGTQTQAGGLNCIPVNMRCKGKLAQLFEFYRALQQLDRLVRIEQVELVNEADFGGEVSMQTKAFIYYESADEQGQRRL
jgi:Tfp pilus assembly protein PilO